VRTLALPMLLTEQVPAPALTEIVHNTVPEAEVTLTEPVAIEGVTVAENT
jgi:hypothetical protein